MMRPAVLLVLLALAGDSLAGAQMPLLEPADVSPLEVGSASGQVLLADLNRDGNLDLVTRHQQARSIRVHLGDGRAHFRTMPARVALRFLPSDMSVGDVNGDRILDLVVTASARDVVDVLLGDGGGGFRHAKGSPFAASRRVYRYNKRSLHLVDVDGDGHLDIVTGNRRGQYAFQVLRGNGTGRFVRGPVITVEPAQEGYTLAFGDVDGDGDVDAVAAVSSPTTGPGRRPREQRPRSIQEGARLGRATGGVSHRIAGRCFPRDHKSSFRAGPGAFNVAIGDVNADGRPDVVASSFESNAVTVLLGR